MKSHFSRICTATFALGLTLAATGAQAAPSFDCGKAQAPAETAICQDKALSALDRKLAAAWKGAHGKATGARKEEMLTEQRKWLEERDACMSETRSRDCLARAYRERIAVLTKPATGGGAKTP